MKSFIMCALIGGLVFSISLGLQLGSVEKPDAESSEAQTKADKAAPPRRLRFPEDLAVTTQARPRPVPQAAAFKASSGPHKLAVLRPGGEVHEWQEYFPEDWRAARVDETELVVVVGSQKKLFVDETAFQNGPPIKRYMYDLVVSVVEPKTGRVIGYRTFRNVPRSIRPREAYETTTLGRPVSWSTVFRWVSNHARIGFPEEQDPNPLVTQTDA